MDQTNSGINIRPIGTEAEIETRLDRAYNSNWNTPEIRDTIKSILSGKSISTQYYRAKALALLLEVQSLIGDQTKKFKLSDIHRRLLWYDIQKPKISSYKKFEEFVNRGPGKSREQIVDYLKDKPRGLGNSKVSPILRNIIVKFYADHRKLNFEEIAKLINHVINDEVKANGVGTAIVKFGLPQSERIVEILQSGKNYLTSSCIKHTVTHEIRNEAMGLRYGRKEAIQALSRPLHRIMPEFPLDKVEIDSTVFPFPFRDGKIVSTKQTTCIVVDVYSGKIIGVAFGKYENADLYLRALYSAFAKHEVLPKEIVCDQFPGNNSIEIAEFKAHLKRLGCLLNIERTGNARAKGTIEKTNDMLSEMMKAHPNFIGKNITTKGSDSRKSKEQIRNMVRVGNLESIEQIRGRIIETIAMFNSRSKKGQSLKRSDVFKSRPQENAIKLSLEDRVWLWNKSIVKQVDAGGLIILRRGYDRFQYEIGDNRLRNLYTGQSVIVKFEESDLTYGRDIYLFDAVTKEFICICKRQARPFTAKANQGPEDIKIITEHINSEKSFKKFQKEKERDIVSADIEVSNYLTSSKIEQIEADNLYELTQMLGISEAQTSITANDFGEGIKVYGKEEVVNPHKRRRHPYPHTKKDDSFRDRLSGYENYDVLGGTDDLDAIMTVDKS